jgi:hypothetical protein
VRLWAAGLPAFLREAGSLLLARRMLVPVVLLTLLLTVTNIVAARTAPQPGAAALPPLFIAAAIARVGGLLVFVVALIRILAASPRPLWLPDGAFWPGALLSILLLAVSGLIGILAGSRGEVLDLVISGVLSALVVAPFAPWLMALTAEKPLAWRPGPWLRDIRAWLPQLVFWSVLLTTPLTVLHGWIDFAVMNGGLADRFWPAMLFDGPLSAVIVLLGLGLNAAAYWRVARR